MTSAAAPAVSGDDWLVPPASSTGDGWPTKLVHSVKIAVSVLQEAKLEVGRRDQVDRAAGLVEAAGR